MPLTAHVEVVNESGHANGPTWHKCSTFHGHSWRIEAQWEYSRNDLDEFGWGPDFGKVKDIMREGDHENLNDLYKFPPSAENIAVYLWERITTTFPVVKNLVVSVFEGGGNSVTYDGIGEDE